MKNTLSVLALAVVGSVSGVASAVSLTQPVGSYQDFAISGTTVAARPELAGVVLEDMLSNFSISGAGENMTGQIQNRVVRSVDGTLDFYWRIINVQGSGDLEAFRVGGFSGFALDADWRIDGLGTSSPDTARYFGDASGSVNFLFGNDIVAGAEDSSRFFFLDTEATNYALTGQFDLLCAGSGCISSLYSTFAPSAVPVPAAAWLFGSGLLGLIGVARRKTKSA